MSSASRHYDDSDREPVIPYCLDTIVLRGFAQLLTGQTRNLDRAVKVLAEVIASLRGAKADASTKVEALGIGGDKCLRKHDDLRAPLRGGGGEVTNLREGRLRLEHNRRA